MLQVIMIYRRKNISIIRFRLNIKKITMKILHYALGFPPYRTGGLTKFCIDLMIQQANEGDIVAMVWPGKIKFVGKKISINRHQNVYIKNQNIMSFEIINPLPVPLDEGIENITAYTKNVDNDAFEELIDNFNPDVIHIHTLMGLHKSFLETAKNKGIRLVFTAHDFFPICPKVTMYKNGTICKSVKNCEMCAMCNNTALSLNQIKILQSSIYRKFKDSLLIKKLRKMHRDEYLSDLYICDNIQSKRTAEDYKRLRNYYYTLLKLMDIIHYNSELTKRVYELFFHFSNSCIIGITHSDIKDNRKKKHYGDNKLRIRYLGPQSDGKGYYLLKAALDELWKKHNRFCLDVHFIPHEISPYMNIHDRYDYNELEKIFDDTDVLVVPSIWYETFGFTVLEGLSYGVPVIISDNVGAKDILVKGAGIIIENMTVEKLCKTLQNLSVNKLSEMNNVIVNQQVIPDIECMSRQIKEKCYV